MTPAASDAFATTAAARPVAIARLAVVSVFASLRRFWQTRQAMHQLSEMSDWQLADIGLTRCDIDVVSLSVAHGDVTRALQELAAERAAVRHRVRMS
ncbi:DUF1127 domain-containing protein [Nitratireductor pacificus]|uniref:YjiS-like domain-containing protein n=1 Tax=Nitratireductor pacificus pht-3B TaxID=391937 RepID=K2MTC9_9HYPH|nr:DUF1127 domain-containing protein [Nitratireductor pacificus]EKF20602.1 hypothetical protein NA2_02419 [Nitratireductor pacificus pht-3B]